MTLKSCIVSIVLLGFLVSGIFFGQSITWQRVYGQPGPITEYTNEVCKADGSNFYVAGSAVQPDRNFYRPFVMKVNEYGDTIWFKYINFGLSADAICATDDGGCVITGDADSAYAVRLNPSGVIVWLKSYGGTAIRCSDIIRTSDAGFLLCGEDFNYSNDGYALKIDSMGIFLWQKLYTARELYAAQEAFDGGYVFSGRIMGATGYLMKTDINGNLMWDKRYHVDSLYTTGKSIIKLSNQYLISGNGGDPPGNVRVCFLRVDVNGNLIFGKRLGLGSNRDHYFYYTAVNSLNRYVFCYEKDTVQDTIFQQFSHAGAVITDSVGNVIVNKILDYPYTFRYTAARSVLVYPNGDLLFGCISAFPSTNYDILLIRTDNKLYSPPYIGITTISNQVPDKFKLSQNYPNPFNPLTQIKFELAENAFVWIKVYNSLGELVETLVNNEYKSAGKYSVAFDGTNLASGIYFYTFETPEYRESKKMVLIR